MFFLCWGSQIFTQYSMWGFMREKQRARTLFWCNLRYDWFPRLQAHIAGSCPHPAVSPSPSEQSCSLPSHSPAHVDIGGCLNPSAGPYTIKISTWMVVLSLQSYLQGSLPWTLTSNYECMQPFLSFVSSLNQNLIPFPSFLLHLPLSGVFLLRELCHYLDV